MNRAVDARWDSEVLFDDGDEFFSDMLAGMDRAQNTIDFETYIFEPGHLANRIVSAFQRALARGVAVRIMVDGIGSPTFWTAWGRTLGAAGAEVRLFRTWAPWRRINRGSHRKFCLVDGQTGWIGSFNVSDVHLASIFGDRAWVDCGARVTGSELQRIKLVHGIARLPRSLSKTFRRSKLLIFNNSFLFGRPTDHKNLQRMRRAHNRIWIQTPYFVPIGPVYRTLRRRARRGVDVRLMVPRLTDVPIVKRMSYAFFARLLAVGVRIFEYKPKFAHQKILQIDDWACIGSSNMNHRSFLHDLELDVVITHPENKIMLKEKFLAEQSESVEITRESLARQGILARLWSYLLLLIRYWC